MSSEPNPSTPAVTLAGVSFAYGDRIALAGMNLSVGAGEIFGILGPNGGGKSTSFKLLSTQLVADAGHCRVFDLDPARDPDAVRATLGVIFQERSLDPKLTVRENLRHQGHLYGLRGKTLAERIRAGLARFGLAERADDRVETLSGGLARRVDLCRGTLHQPRLLLLDEPTTGLDPTGRRELWELLEDLRHDGVTVLLTTHLMDEAERCDRLAILSQGRVLVCGPPEDLRAGLSRDVVEVTSPAPEQLGEALGASGMQAERTGGTLRWATDDGAGDVARVMAHHRPLVDRIQVGRPSLDDVFFAQTGRHLDEDETQPTEPTPTPPSAAAPTATTGTARRPGIWLASVSLARRELVRFFRQRSRIVGTLATPAFFWVLLGTGLGRSFQPPGYGDTGYLEFFYPGMLALTVLFTAIFSTISVIEDRHLGFLQSVLVAPVSRGSIVLGKVLGGAALGMIQGTLLLALAPLAGVGLTASSLAGAVAVLATVALALTGLGFVLAWKIDSTQGYHSAMNMLLVPMWLLSGSVFPSTGNSAWVSWAMRINPLAYGVSALRHALGVPAPGTPSPQVGLAVVAAFGVTMFLVAVALVRRPDHR